MDKNDPRGRGRGRAEGDVRSKRGAVGRGGQHSQDPQSFARIAQGAHLALQDSDVRQVTHPPAGFKNDDPAIEWIKGKSFLGWHEVPGRMVTSRKIVNHVMEVYRSPGSLIEFLPKRMGL